MSEVRTSISFGKIAYYGMRKTAEVVVTIRIRNGYFSICSDVWNTKHTDVYCGGQCYDTVNEYLSGNALWNDIFYLWKKYHLTTFKKIPISDRLLIEYIMKNYTTI